MIAFRDKRVESMKKNLSDDCFEFLDTECIAVRPQSDTALVQDPPTSRACLNRADFDRRLPNLDTEQSAVLQKLAQRAGTL